MGSVVYVDFGNRNHSDLWLAKQQYPHPIRPCAYHDWLGYSPPPVLLWSAAAVFWKTLAERLRCQ